MAIEQGSKSPTGLIESELSRETSQAIRTVRKGFTKLIAEQRVTERDAMSQYPSKGELIEIGKRFGTRGANFLRQAGVDYRTFHQALLRYELVERQRTGEWLTNSSSILYWAMGQESISGHSGN